MYERTETNLVAAPELGKKLAGLEEDAEGGAGTGGRRHGGCAVPRPKKFVCHRVIKHPVVV